MLLPQKDQKVIKKSSCLQNLLHPSGPSGNHLAPWFSSRHHYPKGTYDLLYIGYTHIIASPLILGCIKG